jgi:hypothetical protein
VGAAALRTARKAHVRVGSSSVAVRLPRSSAMLVRTSPQLRTNTTRHRPLTSGMPVLWHRLPIRRSASARRDPRTRRHSAHWSTQRETAVRGRCGSRCVWGYAGKVGRWLIRQYCAVHDFRPHAFADELELRGLLHRTRMLTCARRTATMRPGWSARTRTGWTTTFTALALSLPTACGSCSVSRRPRPSACVPR